MFSPLFHRRPFGIHRLPTHFAAAGGHESILPYLHDNCADFKAFDVDNSNVLHYAVMSASIPTIRYVISEGCGVNHQNYWVFLSPLVFLFCHPVSSSRMR
jgi:ankyrin repeat protein